MDPGVIAVFIPIVIFGGIFTLIGLKMRYSHMEDTRLGGSSQQEVEHLADAVDNLRSEVELLRTEFVEINERMDFTERLLERPKAP